MKLARSICCKEMKKVDVLDSCGKGSFIQPAANVKGIKSNCTFTRYWDL